MAELSRAIARLMQERDRARPQPVVTDASKLVEVLDVVRSRVTPGERPLAEAFVRQLFDKAGAELLAEGAVPQLADMALGACRFVIERSLDEPRVRVFEPPLTDTGWRTGCTVVETLMGDRPFIVDTIREC